MECYTILGSEGRTDEREQRRENRGRWRERNGERERARRKEIGGREGRQSRPEERGEGKRRRERRTFKVGGRRTGVGIRWRRGQGVRTCTFGTLDAHTVDIHMQRFDR